MEDGPPMFNQDFTCPDLLFVIHTISSLSYKGLSPTMAELSRFILLKLLIDYGNWAVPRSLAATNRISVDFFSSGYLDVSVLRVRFMYPM